MEENKNRVSVIIPAYNEEENIKAVIKGIKSLALAKEIILVDDGSADKTAEIAAGEGISVIRHSYNVGNGAAVKTGVRHSTGDILVLIDGDGQYNPEDIPALLKHINEYDMVVGSRAKGAKVLKFRSFGNFCLTRVASFLSEKKIEDLTSGFRVIKSALMKEYLHLLPNTYSYPTTITLALLKSGYLVKYVPLVNVKKRQKGQSNIRPLQDGLRFLLIISRIIMLFDPLKIFLPVSFSLLTMGFVMLIVNIIMFMKIKQATMLFLILGVFIFFFGLLADQNAHIRRELRQK